MGPYVLIAMNIIDKSLDIVKNLIDIDNKYNRRIIRGQDNKGKYLAKLNESKILLKSAIAENNKTEIAKLQKQCEYYNELYLYYTKKVDEYEKLHKNNTKNNSDSSSNSN